MSPVSCLLVLLVLAALAAVLFIGMGKGTPL